jgi:hypothetical protein
LLEFLHTIPWASREYRQLKRRGRERIAIALIAALAAGTYAEAQRGGHSRREERHASLQMLRKNTLECRSYRTLPDPRTRRQPDRLG